MTHTNNTYFEICPFFRGMLTFWDGHKGLQMDVHQTHKADILSVCLNSEESKLYCAGKTEEISIFSTFCLVVVSNLSLPMSRC